MIRGLLWCLLTASALGSLGCIAQIHYVVPDLESNPGLEALWEHGAIRESPADH